MVVGVDVGANVPAVGADVLAVGKAVGIKVAPTTVGDSRDIIPQRSGNKKPQQKVWDSGVEMKLRMKRNPGLGGPSVGADGTFALSEVSVSIDPGYSRILNLSKGNYDPNAVAMTTEKQTRK
eukprot:845069-Prorocentrum_minimum.AAC.1